jgi:hypothetical protein
LGLNRILFVGDHTTMTQAISLASILGQNADISLDTTVVPNFAKTITCAGTSIGSFELSYVRNDRLEETTGAAPSPGSPNCGPNTQQYCYPWTEDFSSYSGKQLLIVNTGYHWLNDWEGYIGNFQNFVGKIDEIAAVNAVRVSLMYRCCCLLVVELHHIMLTTLSVNFHYSFNRQTTSSCSVHQFPDTKNVACTTVHTFTTKNTALV